MINSTSDIFIIDHLVMQILTQRVKTRIKGFTRVTKWRVFGIVDECLKMVRYFSTEQAVCFNKLIEADLKLEKGLI